MRTSAWNSIYLLADRPNGNLSPRPQPVDDTDELEQLAAGETERGGVGAGLKLQRQHAHVDQIAPMDPLEAFRDHGLDAQQHRFPSPPNRATTRSRTPCRRG